ncbi:Omp28-related outer membrane protein [Lacinutrix jangbogonensis]|uniref:Omp28-related outer membrane protein n=1 Tax=Lacinutrix jangbogonensis TaxID=1469557 RepID=UPI0006899105|nr:Omp28-related outer membrane protein [Lacinutrix jangbogonensis]
MRVKNFLKELAVLSFVVFAFACSSDDGNGEGSGSGGGSASASSITVEGNVSTISVGESVTFGVVNNQGVDITSSSVFTIDGTVITNPYTFDTSGTFVVTATNGTFTSSTTIVVGVATVPTALIMTTNVNDFWFDDGSASFVVTDDLGNNVTALVVYTAESGTLTNPAVFASAGTYNAIATYTLADNTTITSNTVVLNAVASTHTTKVMIEDYTGTWCGYCPRLATALENVVNQNANVIPVAVHDDSQMEFQYVNQMANTFGVTGFPTGKVNRTIEWNESTNQPISYLSTRQHMGLAINSSLSGNSITAEVKVHYDLKIGYANRIVVYLLENGLVYNQVNYYNGDTSSEWYQTGNPIVGFVHDHVARTVFTDIFGDVIPAADANTGSTYTANYNLTVPSSVQNTANLELVAFVVGTDNKVLNVQKASLGENKDFD